MDYIAVLQDSIDTSISMKLFKSREESSVDYKCIRYLKIV